MRKRPYLGDPEQIPFVTAISDCWINHTHARSQSQDFVVSINLAHCVVQCLAKQPTGWYENLLLEDCSHLQGNDVSLAPVICFLPWREELQPKTWTWRWMRQILSKFKQKFNRRKMRTLRKCLAMDMSCHGKVYKLVSCSIVVFIYGLK